MASNGGAGISMKTGSHAPAVIWYSDLEGFTCLADTLPRAKLLALPNDYRKAPWHYDRLFPSSSTCSSVGSETGTRNTV